MTSFNFITVRLGKDSLPDIDKICKSDVGILKEVFTINVKCTQIPDNYNSGDYAFVWLGSDNNKGMPTKWKQGFKAVGRVKSINRGNSYNDQSETTIDIIYVFHNAINRMDILRSAPIAYYWCSSLPLIGIDDHANQTIRSMSNGTFSDIRAFFVVIESATNSFRSDIVQIEPAFDSFFDITLPNPQDYPFVKNLGELPILSNNKERSYPLQQIFYGAPGTGKSDEVDDVCSKYLHYRITFHPDTDYSAFVGCYKPKTHKKNMLAGNGINETQLLSSFFDSNSSKYSGKTKARYLYESLVHTKDIRDLGLDAQTIADKLRAQDFSGCAYDKESNCMFNIYDWLKEDGYVVENKISYEFTPQCFIKAYVDAWKNQKEGKPVFLVIEEINRGNCAQIFGDLFQLLDRDKNGFSRYEISPDTDLQEYIAEIGLNISGVTDHEGKDISALIASGELMKLPNNLYIWATMNTSDQSLFPIDSAFKRRWDWKYIKIKKGIDKVTKQKLNWKIRVGEETYDWWEFIRKINHKINRMTSSADKQLGYFFCLADGKGEICADTFVNKVAFYLWNDVFKDYAEDGSPLLKYKKKEEDTSESDLTFPDFFEESGEINTYVVKQFIEKAMKEDEMDKPTE